MDNSGVTILVILEATSLVLTVSAIGFAIFAVRKAKKEMQKAVEKANFKAERFKAELKRFTSALETL